MRIENELEPSLPEGRGLDASGRKNLRWLLVAAGPDLLILSSFSIVFLILALIYRAELRLKEGAILLPSAMAGVLILISFLVGERATFPKRARQVLRDWAPFIALNFVYENLRMYTGLIRPIPIDASLDAADRAIFGASPTLWMKHVQSPLLTDYMSLAYGLYFILPLSIVALLYWRRRREDFRELALALVLCLYGGFLLFVIFPAGPPRFYGPLMRLFDPPHLSSYFGLWEWSQDAWDSVNPVKVYASFPSLHCAMAMVTVLYSWRFGDLLKPSWVLFGVMAPLCASLWISTVYLRHHWVVDVFAGWILGVGCFVAAGQLRRAFERLALPRPATS